MEFLEIRRNAQKNAPIVRGGERGARFRDALITEEAIFAE